VTETSPTPVLVALIERLRKGETHPVDPVDPEELAASRRKVQALMEVERRRRPAPPHSIEDH
jgi:hypothetical protein